LKKFKSISLLSFFLLFLLDKVIQDSWGDSVATKHEAMDYEN
jgi:hypothetical protein